MGMSRGSITFLAPAVLVATAMARACPPGYRVCPDPSCQAVVSVYVYANHIRRCKRMRDSSSSSDGSSSDGGVGFDSGEVGDGATGDEASDEAVEGSERPNNESSPRADAQDPGILPDSERRQRLLRWCLANPHLDPRNRVGAFNWSQIESVFDANMSEGVARRHFERLHRQDCARLNGLSIHTRDDASRFVRSLLDDNPATMWAASTTASLHFEEEVLHVWNGVLDSEDTVPRKIVLRELVPVVLATYLAPSAYGRQRTRYHAPTVGGEGTERIYSDPLTSDYFRRAEASVTVGLRICKQIVSFDLFYDETVIESNGKRYKP